MSLSIYIPTMGRIDFQVTWDNLPEELQRSTKLVCPEAEYKEHKAKGRNVLVCKELGIARTRQWILEQEQGKYLCMLDDDIKFSRRRSDGSFTLCSPPEVEASFQMMESLLTQYVQVGMAWRNHANKFGGVLENNHRMFSCHAYDVAAVRKIGLQFYPSEADTKYVMDDFYATLSILTAGFQNALITEYVWDERGGGSNAPGGASVYRDFEAHNRSARLLEKSFPRLVRLRWVKTKGAWKGLQEGKGRLDVVVSWKEAYAMGLATRRARLF